MKQNDWLAISGVGILLILILAGIFAPLITSYDPNQIDLTDKLSNPSFTHLLGTDYLGRDLFSRILYESRATLLLGTVLTIIILVLGVVIGCIAAINNGKIAAVIDGICTLFLTLPSEMLVLVIIAVVGQSLEGLNIAIVIPRWPWYVRMIKNDVKKILSTNYVQYAKLSGNSMFVILRKHVFPNISSQIMVYTTLDMGALITSIAALSFLGIGIQAPTAEWGRMLNEAREVANVYPWQMIPAGVVIFLVTLILNYLGDSLEGKNNAFSD